MDKVAQPRRIQRQRTKDWRMPENTVYVGRPSRFGNPFQYRDGVYDATQYRLWIESGLEDKAKWIMANLHLLTGKNLCCWCKLDEPCHADVLLELANTDELKRNNNE